MPGHIKKRGQGSWTVVVEQGRDPTSGKRRQLWRTVQGTKKDAEAYLIQLLHERNGGIDVHPGRLTLGQYLERWLDEYAEHSVSARTHERYAGIVHNHLIPALGSVQLAKLRPQQIQAYYGRALKEGRADKRAGGLSARTVLHHHRVLREALHQAVRWQVLARNPADGVEPPRPSRPEMHVLTPDGVQQLLDACVDPEMRALAFTAVATGLRQGELLALRWSDLDLPAARLEVTRTLQYLSGKGLSFAPPKTEKSRRRVSLSPETGTALAEHRRRQAEHRLRLGSGFTDQGLVFPEALGGPQPPFRVSHRFATVVKRAGVGPLRFHDLRHTHATLLLRAGVHPKVVSERLGHTSVTITLDTYSHVLPGLQEEAANLLDGYLKPRSSESRLANG